MRGRCNRCEKPIIIGKSLTSIEIYFDPTPVPDWHWLVDERDMASTDKKLKKGLRFHHYTCNNKEPNEGNG